MEAINDSLKHVAKSVELVKSYIEVSKVENEPLLNLALELLEKTVEDLSKSVSHGGSKWAIARKDGVIIDAKLVGHLLA